MTHEQQMIRDVLDGKAEAFRWIVERYQGPVFRLVNNFVHDRHAAEDITQDVLMTAYEKLSTFDVMRSRFSTWLFTIARNKSINCLRNRKKTALINARDTDGSVCTAERMQQQEFFRQMDDALNRLPAPQKRAFVLAEFENLPYDQIAQIECVSIGTVKSRIHRAKQKLRKAFDRISGERE